MIFDSRTAAAASLREFSPWLRPAHSVVKFWSDTHGRFRWTRVLTSASRNRANCAGAAIEVSGKSEGDA